MLFCARYSVITGNNAHIPLAQRAGWGMAQPLINALWMKGMPTAIEQPHRVALSEIVDANGTKGAAYRWVSLQARVRGIRTGALVMTYRLISRQRQSFNLLLTQGKSVRLDISVVNIANPLLHAGVGSHSPRDCGHSHETNCSGGADKNKSQQHREHGVSACLALGQRGLATTT